MMMLFDEIPRLLEESIELLRANEPPDGYYGCFSGGKDSVLIKAIAELANVKVDWHYNVTTIDPPELVRFIRREHPNVEFVRPRHGNFFRRMEKKGFPTRRNRWCCEEYKESTNPDRTLIMGIRSEESPARKARWSHITTHFKTGSLVVCPAFNWASDELWDFIKERKIAYCELYDQGWHRLGCIGCPMSGASGRLRDFSRWPRYKRLWMRSFRRIWDRRTGTMPRNGRRWFGDEFFNNWEEMWDWWLHDRPLPKNKDDRQMEIFEIHPAARKR